MRAVIYARYSSDNQREESIEGQLRECLQCQNFYSKLYKFLYNLSIFSLLKS